MILRRILMIRTDRMGDLLMSLPAVHAVHAAYPAAERWLLVQRGLEPLLEGHPDITRLITWDPREPAGRGWGGILRWGWRLRRIQADAVVVLNPTKLFHAAAFLAGIPVRIGYRRKLGRLLTDGLPDTKAARGLHETAYNLELVQRLGGIPLGDPVLALPRRPALEAEAERILWERHLLAAGRPVAIHPWTSHPAKAWPLDRFAEAAGRLVATGVPVLIIGGPEESPRMARARAGLPEQAVDLVGQVPLRLLPALLRRCAALLSNDSGPAHVAAAVGTPTVVVAPGAHAPLLARWRPLGPAHQLLLDPTVEAVLQALASAPRGAVSG